ncbi:MAG: hypothetical protein RIF32_19585 [Leptospirales bacterium]|jgi:hypothetical protein
MTSMPEIFQEIPCGRFVYRLNIYANAELPAGSASEALRAMTPPSEVGEGFPLVLIVSPPDADQPGPGDENDALPTQRVRLALFWIAPDSRGSGDQARSEPAQIVERIEKMLINAQAVSSAIEGLGELATSERLQIQASVIELAAGGVGEAGGLDDETLERILPKRFHAALAEERAREATLAYVQVCTAGLPPLVHVYSGGIIFPIRSWVPAGLYPDWQPLCQSIECEVGDRLIVHTELTTSASAAGLKEFHESLQRGAGDWSLFKAHSGSGLATRIALELRIEFPAEESE